jgi:hypothetical protein
LRNSSAVLVLLYSSALFAQTVRVPFVGCESDGQVDPLEAPKGADKVVQMKASVANRLAYYKASVAPGLFAPRGWYCFGIYGSGGSSLFVSPMPIKRGDFPPNWAGINGPAVQVDNVDGGTSGRFEVAQVLARIFPAQRTYVQSVINSFDQSASDYTFGPYPNDKLIVQKDRLVQYRTAPRSEGLGTMSRLKANDDPIDGVALLQGQTPDLLMLRVRLPLKQRDLAAVIIQQLLIWQRSDAR